MSATERRSPIKLSRLVFWPLEEDTESTLEYGAAVEFTKSLMTAVRTPSQQTADQSADDQVVEDIALSTGGQLAIGIRGLLPSDYKLLYGNKLTGRTVVQNKDDLPNYLACAYMTGRTDKLVNLYKVFKVSFAEQAENFATKQKSSINFATTTLQGNYIETIKDGNSVAILLGVDPVTEKEIIDEWLAQATNIGSEI